MNKNTKYAELLDRIASGDRAAESQLINEFLRGLNYILFRQTRDRELSEDLTQEALMVVLQNARNNKIKSPGALASYVRQTGINLLIAHKRLQHVKRTFTDQQFVESVKSVECSVLITLSQAQMSEYVRKVIENMSVKRDTEILRRHFLLDQDKSIICAELDLTPAHYDRVLFRAKVRLKKMIVDDKDFDGFDPGPGTDPVLMCLFVSLVLSAAVQTERTPLAVRDSTVMEHYISITFGGQVYE